MAISYNGLAFETKLLAQWAAFFDLAGWTWSRGVYPIGNWKPDYRVTFACSHSECRGSHTILVSVLPVSNTEEIKGHPALKHFYSVEGPDGKSVADAGAIFGADYHATRWQMSHGAGGGIESVYNWTDDPVSMWQVASTRIDSYRD